MFSAAIFDLDGLLIDSERAFMEAWIAGARSVGVPLTAEQYAGVIGLADPESYQALAALLGGAAVFAAVQAEVERRWAERADPAEFALKAGARELLARLRAAGVPCAVASSTGAADVRARLARTGLLGHFDALAGGDEVSRGKPDPAVYRLALQRLGALPAACLAFEDSAHGASAALDAGLQVVLVPDLRAPPPELAARSLRVLASLEEAVGWLPDWFATPLPSPGNGDDPAPLRLNP